MAILKDVLASAVGIGPNFKISHQNIRDLFRLDGGEYTPDPFRITSHMYHTLPMLDYGSTKEGDEFTAILCEQSTPGGSVADQWYNTAFPDGKKARQNREGFKAHHTEDGISKGPQILYNYYENGMWPGPRLAVLVVDELATEQEHGTDMSNVKYGFKAKLENWSDTEGEYKDIELTHLYVNGNYVPMGKQAMAAANDYATRLTAMIFSDDGAAYNPELAMAETLDRFGEDVFQVSAWQARRGNDSHFKHDSI